MVNNELTNCVERLRDEFQGIFNYVEFYEDFFYRRKKDVIEEISDNVTSLLEEYIFQISDSMDEQKN